jgi:hypothetical protein
MLAACGGSGGAADAADSDARLTSPASAPPTPAAAPPAADATNTLRVSLPSGSETNYPLQFGRAFAKGEIRRVPRVLLDGAMALQAQVDVKTRHDDGSVRFAVVSVVLPSLGVTERVLGFADADAPSAAPETVANMLADYDFEATIRVADNTGTVLAGSPTAARTMLSALTDAALAAETTAGGSGPRYWTQGPVCTTVLLHDHNTKAYDIGTNATKAMRPMFIVQFWPGIKRYRVRHILETADVTKLKEEIGISVQFTTGHSSPTIRLSQMSVNLFMGSFASREYWGGQPLPRSNLDHGLSYLSKCKVVPNFDTSFSINSASLTAYRSRLGATDRALGASGDWTKSMPATGGRVDIGLMPKWDVVLLYTGSAHMHEYSECQAELAGWWNMHFREGSALKTVVPGKNGQGRVLSKMAGGRPTHSWFGVNPAVGDEFTRDGPQTGRDGWGADDAHTPGLYFVPYITTGSYFWYEKLLQLGAFSFFFVNPSTNFSSVGNGRSSTDMILNGIQVRSFGWQMRNRARSWWAAVDGSPEKTLFTQSMQDGLAQRAGLFDLPNSFLGNAVREAWNTNHAAHWSNIRDGMVSTPRPNAMGWAACGIYDFGSNGFNLPTDAKTSTALWQQNFCATSLAHASELGYVEAQPLAEWFGLAARRIATSSEPRHLGDYVIPNVKTDGTFFQSPESIWSTYAHNADTAQPPDMPNNASDGFSQSGTVGNVGVTVEGYGSISAAAIAMTASASDGPSAWSIVRRWHLATALYDHDPRWAIVPRG